MGQKGDQNQEQQGVLDQSSCSELNSTVGSCSLRSELSNISVMLSKLKTYSPERKNSRSDKGQLPQKDCLSKIIEYLDNIHQLNTKLVSKVDELAEENNLLKQQIDSSQESRSSYATRATCTSSSNAERPGSFQSAINPAPQDLKMMTTKIDELEQETLTNVIMLQGPAVECIVSNNSERAPTNGSTDGSHRHSKFAHLKTAVFECFRAAAVPIQMDHITAVWPQGRDRKHLKVVCSSFESKISLLSTIRNHRPENIYANEYLTKHRASLLYKLRNLKRQHPDITSVYSHNGVVGCKIRGGDRPHTVYEISDVNKIELKMLNAK